MSDNNYICCQWRDAITDLPDGTICCVLRGGLGQGSTPAAYLLGEGWIRCDRPQMMPVEEGDQWLDVTDIPAVPRAQVQAELEAERMRLAACSVAALSNTRESAKAAREIPDEYKSASWHDVCAAVDREMDLRESMDAIPRAQVQAAVDEMTKYADEIPGTRCARGLKWARQLIKGHTGVVPTEVSNEH